MKTLFAFSVLMISLGTFARGVMIEKEFKATHTQEGMSFVALVAYEKAVKKAQESGFYYCSDRYQYRARQTITGKWKATAWVNCYKEENN